MGKIQVKRFVVTELEENCYVVSDEAGNAVVIDPGGGVEEILAYVREQNLTVRMILNTHGHIDHIYANAELRDATQVKIGIHPLDAPMLESKLLSGALWVGWADYREHKADFLLLEDEPVVVGEMRFEVFHTPGHSPGSCSLLLREAGLLFDGDLVFQGAVGRWDLPGADPGTLMQSIREKFLTLPDEVRVLPGHGAETTVGEERRTNRYLMAPYIDMGSERVN